MRLTIRVILGLLVLSLFATSGAAQDVPSGTNTTTANNTTTTSSGNNHWINNGSSIGGVGSGGGGGGLFGFNPVEYLSGLLSGFSELAVGSIKWVFKQIIDFFVGVDHPTNDGPMGIFGTPTNQPYKALFWNIYMPVTIGLAAAVLVMLASVRAAIKPFTGLISTGHQSTITVSVIACAVWFTLWWPLSTFVEMFIDVASRSIAPKPGQIIGSFGALMKLGAAPVVGSVTIAAVGFIEVFILGLVYKLVDTALLVYKVGMPILITGAYLGPHRRIRSLCSGLAWQWVNLVTMTLPISFLLLVSWTLEWSISPQGIGAVFTSIALLLLGIAYPIVSTYLTSRGGMEQLSRKTARKTSKRYRKYRSSDDEDGDSGEKSGIIGTVRNRVGGGTATDGGEQQTLGDYTQSANNRDRLNFLRRKQR